MTREPLIGPRPGPELHVMTYNIRRPVPRFERAHPDRWQNRRDALVETIRREAPAIVGAQEAMPEQLAFLAAGLDRYTVLGYGRGAGGGGEGVPVLVDEGRLEVLAWDQFALSERPEVPGSRSWATSAPRAAVRAHLRDRVTGATFTVVNTHLDVLSGWARIRGAQLIASRVTDGRAIVLGDANATVRSRAYRTLVRSGELRDAWVAAERRLTPEWKTLALYKKPRQGPRIDWVLVSPEIEVVSIGINGDATGSDHLPVQALVRIPA